MADLGGWTRARMPVMPEAPFFDLAPDWVAEVLSPSTAATDRVRKMRINARERVAFVWLIDPMARTLEVFKLDGDAYRFASMHEGEEKVRAVPFEAIELDLAVLWQR